MVSGLETVDECLTCGRSASGLWSFTVGMFVVLLLATGCAINRPVSQTLSSRSVSNLADRVESASDFHLAESTNVGSVGSTERGTTIFRASSECLAGCDSTNQMDAVFSQPVYEPGRCCETCPRPACPSCQSPCPGCCSEFNRLNLCNDIQSLPSRLQEDISALATCENVLFLGAAAGVTVALRDNVDGRVIHDNELHAPRWNKVSEVLSHGGDAFLVHAPLLAGMYATSLWEQDDDLHELTLTMFTSYKFAVFGSLGLQYATGTRHTGSSFFDTFKDSGFPSEATAGSFALAAVVDERYGWTVGMPAYLVSGLIGWSEIDQNHNRVSDVVFGAALGYVIGKSIGASRYRPNDPFKLVPIVDGATGTQGMGFEYRY